MITLADKIETAGGPTYELTRSQHATLVDMVNYPAGYFRREATMRLLVGLGLVESKFVKVYLRELWFRTPAGDNLAGQPWARRMALSINAASPETK